MSEVERIRQEKMKKLQDQAQMPRAPITVTDSNFEETLKKYDAVVVDLWASWCMPCKMIAPSVEALAEKMAGEVVFAKLNVDENPRTASKYQVMSIPTLLVFKKGAPVKRIVGAQPQQQIEQQIVEVL
jgi:thioredoxin 1